MPIRHNTDTPRSSLWNNDHVGGLGDLDDVTLTGVAVGDYIKWDGTSWVPVGATIVVMRPGITNPPEPVLNPDGDGWVYAEQ